MGCGTFLKILARKKKATHKDPSTAHRHGLCLLILKKKWKKVSMHLSPSAWGNISASSAWSAWPETGCGTRSTSLWTHRNLLGDCQERNSHGSGISGAMTASPKPSFRAPWQCRGQRRKFWMDNVKEWTFPPKQNGSRWPPAEKTGRGPLLNRPSFPSDDPIAQGTELNWTTAQDHLRTTQIDRQTDKQTDRHTYIQTDRQVSSWCLW